MSWPIGSGHPCVGCAEPYFWDTMTPFYERLPKVAGFGVEVTADQLGVGIVAGTAAAFTAHGVLKSMQRKRAERAQEEKKKPSSTEEGR
jgi:hydrogenase small subunit